VSVEKKPVIRNWLNLIINIPAANPDDARRRRLLSIVLIGMAMLSLIALLATLIVDLSSPPVTSTEQTTGLTLFYIGGVVLFIGSFALYLVNRYLSGTWASGLFLLLLTLVFLFSDDPIQVTGGRSLFAFTIPIVMASVLIRPIASFLYAGLTDIFLMLMAFNANGQWPNIPALVGFFMIALVSWLSAASLEDALKQLRLINQELDQRVADRTRQLAEALSREQAEASQIKAILESIADGVVVFNQQNQAIVANPALTQLTELTPERVTSSDLSAFIAAGQLNELDRKALTSLISSPPATHQSIRVTWGRRVLSVNVALVQNSQNVLIGKVAAFRDFTREAELEKMKDTFIAMVSHELRTPLNAILGYTEMLQDAFYGPLNEKQSNATGRIMTNTQRLLGIVNDLLNQAQIEAGTLKFKNAPFTPTEMLDNLRGVMEKIVQDKGLQLITCIDPSMPPELIGDSARMQQILVNLVNNAVKFTDKGFIRVDVASSDSRTWEIKISDTGQGIPGESQHLIFEPFRQVDETATRRHGGIGLGLSIVKKLVELMGGSITVQSTVGEGSAFTLSLPLNLPQAKETNHAR